MKKKTFIGCLLAFSIITVYQSCKKDEEEPIETEPIQQEAEDELVDPFYSVINEDSTLEDYWDLFVADAIRSGKSDPGFERTVNLFFGTEPDFASGVTADHAGRAYDVCNQETVSFEIIKSESLGIPASESFNETFDTVPVFSMLIQSFFFAWAIAALKSSPCKLLRISSNVLGPS